MGSCQGAFWTLSIRGCGQGSQRRLWKDLRLDERGNTQSNIHKTSIASRSSTSWVPTPLDVETFRKGPVQCQIFTTTLYVARKAHSMESPGAIQEWSSGHSGTAAMDGRHGTNKRERAGVCPVVAGAKGISSLTSQSRQRSRVLQICLLGKSSQLWSLFP